MGPLFFWQYTCFIKPNPHAVREKTIHRRKTMKKRLLSILLALVLVLSLLPAGALALGENTAEVAVVTGYDQTASIGMDMDWGVYIQYVEVPAGTTAVCFTDDSEYHYEIYDLDFGFGDGEEAGQLGQEIALTDAYAYTDGVFDVLDEDDEEIYYMWTGHDLTGSWIFRVYDAEEYEGCIMVVAYESEVPAPAEIPFTAASAGSVLPDVRLIEGGYTGYAGSVPLYTVLIPAGTGSVTLDFGENEYVTYYYGATADEFVAANDTQDYQNGQKGHATAVLGDLSHFVWVQTPYAADWMSGGELQYVVNFQVPFTAAADGAALTDISAQAGAYSYYDYYHGTTATATVYTVLVPFGTETVELSYPDYRLTYNYTAAGDYISGAVTNFTTGDLTATVTVDDDEDGTPDYIQVQTPYDANYNSELLFVITFRTLFRAEAGETLLTAVSSQAAGYTPYAYDYASDSMVPGESVTLYTVTVPDGTESVTLSFPAGLLAYNYTADGVSWLAGSYDNDDLFAGVETVTVPVDANSDGEPDAIQVQTPYDEDWYSETLFAIGFAFESGLPDDPEPAEPWTLEELRDNLAARYAQSAAEDAQAPWIAADMAAYGKLFPASENLLTDAQKTALKDKAIEAIASTASLGDTAKYTLALVALGYDPARLTTSAGEALSAADKLDELAFQGGAPTAAASNVYTLPYVLIAYQQLPGTDSRQEKLVTAALADMASWLDTTYGPDAATAMMLALAPYYGVQAIVTEALSSAAAAVRACLVDAGGVGDAWGEEGSVSAASTGLAMAAFAAIGQNPAAVQASSGKSLADGLLAASTAADGFGNSFSDEQGFRGLVALSGAQAGLPYRIYDFSGQTLIPAEASAASAGAAFTVVPEDAVVTVTDETGETVSPVAANRYDLAAGTYTYTVSKAGYDSQTGSFTLTAEDEAARTRLSFAVSLSPSAPSEDTESVTVTVRILVHDGTSCNGAVTYKNNPALYTSLLTGESFTVTLEKGVGTGRDALVTALNGSGVSFTELSNGYFREIGGYEEMAHGPRSGWLYLINGQPATGAANGLILYQDTELTWFYTDDYTLDYGSENWADENGVSAPAGTVVTTAQAADGTVTVNVTVNGQKADQVPGGVVVQLPAAESTSVLVLVDADGRETVVKKSLTEDGSVYALLPGSCTVKVVDNAKTFRDVEGHWAMRAIDFVTSREIFQGEGDGVFAPEETLSRAMLATAIFNLEGAAATGAGAAFDDVPAGTWYTDTVAWAAETGIVQGADGHFNPEADITREEMITMICRYVRSLGVDTAGTGSLSAFPDGDSVSAWAREAMVWAVGVGLVRGDEESRLDPAGTATRAEAAQLLENLVRFLVK